MKSERQQKIIEIIEKYRVDTQEELAEILEKEGTKAAQATLSRDIKELELTKIVDQDGVSRYILPKQYKRDFDEKYLKVLRSGFVSIEMAQNIVVIKTLSGMGMAVAVAIDELRIDGVVGCIGGDDTLFLAIRTMSDGLKVIQSIKILLK